MGQLQNWQDVIRSHEFIKDVAVVEGQEQRKRFQTRRPDNPQIPISTKFSSIGAFSNCRENFFLTKTRKRGLSFGVE